MVRDLVAEFVMGRVCPGCPGIVAALFTPVGFNACIWDNFILLSVSF